MFHVIILITNIFISKYNIILIIVSLGHLYIFITFETSMYKIQAAETEVLTTVEIHQDLLEDLKRLTETERNMVVHCYIPLQRNGLVRIWNTTYLQDAHSSERTILKHAFGVSLAPVWTRVDSDCLYHFILVFGALSKSCTSFHLQEIIPEPGGFFIQNISRNTQDIYHVNIDE